LNWSEASKLGLYMNIKTVIVLIGAAAVITIILHVITPNQKDTPPTPEISRNSSNKV